MARTPATMVGALLVILSPSITPIPPAPSPGRLGPLHQDPIPMTEHGHHRKPAKAAVMVHRISLLARSAPSPSQPACHQLLLWTFSRRRGLRNDPTADLRARRRSNRITRTPDVTLVSSSRARLGWMGPPAPPRPLGPAAPLLTTPPGSPPPHTQTPNRDSTKEDQPGLHPCYRLPLQRQLARLVPRCPRCPRVWLSPFSRHRRRRQTT